MSTALFHGEDVPQSAAEKALFHIIPVPLEKTVSYGCGTAGGPQAILDASTQLELFDGKSIPAQYGLHTTAFIDCSPSMEKTLDQIEHRVADTLKSRAIPLILGGEHSLSFPCIEAVRKQYGPIGVIHFDAHADLRASYEDSRHSHACVMRRVHEKGVALFQIGTRNYCLEEQNYRMEQRIGYRDAETIWRKKDDPISLPPDFPTSIYISFDADCFDASLMPATGTPSPGGLFWHQVTAILEELLHNRICLGFDLVELAPHSFLHGPAFTMAQLAYTIMGYITRSEVNRDFHRIGA